MPGRAAYSARPLRPSAWAWSGHYAIANRLGRNACFASIGNGLSAAAMGVSGYFVSSQAVFFLTAALCLPSLIALSYIHEEDEIDPARAPTVASRTRSHGERARNRPSCAPSLTIAR